MIVVVVVVVVMDACIMVDKKSRGAARRGERGLREGL